MLVWKPLQYKTIVTKKRLHLIVFGVFFVIALENILATAFFSHPYPVWKDYCSVLDILEPTAYYIIILMNSAVLNTVMILTFTGLIFLLRRRAQTPNTSTNNQTNSVKLMYKLTKATSIALGVYMILQVPGITVEFVHLFKSSSEILEKVLYDYVYFVLCLNNVANPVIYYFTLKDFKEGYQKCFLCCGKWTWLLEAFFLVIGTELSLHLSHSIFGEKYSLKENIMLMDLYLLGEAGLWNTFFWFVTSWLVGKTAPSELSFIPEQLHWDCPKEKIYKMLFSLPKLRVPEYSVHTMQFT